MNTPTKYNRKARSIIIVFSQEYEAARNCAYVVTPQSVVAAKHMAENGITPHQVRQLARKALNARTGWYSTKCHSLHWLLKWWNEIAAEQAREQTRARDARRIEMSYQLN